MHEARLKPHQVRANFKNVGQVCRDLLLTAKDAENINVTHVKQRTTNRPVENPLDLRESNRYGHDFVANVRKISGDVVGGAVAQGLRLDAQDGYTPRPSEGAIHLLNTEGDDS